MSATAWRIPGNQRPVRVKILECAENMLQGLDLAVATRSDLPVISNRSPHEQDELP
jgi:hypothetical protein